MEIISIPIEELTPDPHNAKKHPKEQVEQIKASIEQFGNLDPIGVWGDNNLIVEGHGRYLALCDLGYHEAECIRLDWLTDEERKVYALAHNKLTMNSGFDFDELKFNLDSIQDFDMSEFGFSDDIQELDHEPTDAPVDDGYDPLQGIASKVHKGDIYQLGEHRLICGDSTSDDVARLMDGAKADLLITDPPYGVDYSSKNEFYKKVGHSLSNATPIHNDAMPAEQEMDHLWIPAFKQALSVAAEDCSYYVFSPQGGELMMMMMMSLQRAGWQLKHTLIWVKNSLVLGRSDYNYQHEPVLYGWNKKHHFYGHADSSVIDDAKPEDLKKMSKADLLDWALTVQKNLADDSNPDILRFPRPQVSDLHPTMKPVPLVGYLIGNNTKQGDSVLDLFGGSGTTLIACEQMRRKCYMVEYDEHYCDVIIDRWEKFTGQTAKLIVAGKDDNEALSESDNE